MAPKKNRDRYEFDVVSQDFIPNRENPQRVEITVETEIDGETVQIGPLGFEPRQVAEGTWEKHICRKIDDKIDERRGQTKHDVPDLEGEHIENSGYDFTGPKGTDRYPERDGV